MYNTDMNRHFKLACIIYTLEVYFWAEQQHMDINDSLRSFFLLHPYDQKHHFGSVIKDSKIIHRFILLERFKDVASSLAVASRSQPEMPRSELSFKVFTSFYCPMPLCIHQHSNCVCVFFVTVFHHWGETVSSTWLHAGIILFTQSELMTLSRGPLMMPLALTAFNNLLITPTADVKHIRPHDYSKGCTQKTNLINTECLCRLGLAIIPAV